MRGIVGRRDVGYRASVLRRLLLVVARRAGDAAPASAFSKEDGIADDGRRRHDRLTRCYTPDGAQPAGGWPGVLVLHGLGGHAAARSTRSRRSSPPPATRSLAYDARGHGASGGEVTLAGPREVADLRAAPERVRAPPGGERHEDRRLGHLLRRRPDLERARGRRAVRGGRGGRDVDVALRRALAAGSRPLRDRRRPRRLGRRPLAAHRRPARRRRPEPQPRRDPAADRASARALARRRPALDHDPGLPLPGPRRLRLRHHPGDARPSRASAGRRSSTSATSATRPRPSRARTSPTSARRAAPGSTASSRARANGVDTGGSVVIAKQGSATARTALPGAAAHAHARRSSLAGTLDACAGAPSSRGARRRCGARSRPGAAAPPASPSRSWRATRASSSPSSPGPKVVAPRRAAAAGRRQRRQARELLRLRPAGNAPARRASARPRRPDSSPTSASPGSGSATIGPVTLTLSTLANARLRMKRRRAPPRARARVDRGRRLDGRSGRHARSGSCSAAPSRSRARRPRSARSGRARRRTSTTSTRRAASSGAGSSTASTTTPTTRRRPSS